MFRPPELYNLTKPCAYIYIYIYIIRGRSPQCLGPPWRGSAALAVAIKSGSARSPKDRANADLLARVVPGIALLASGLLRSRIRPDASAADPRVPPVNGFFFRGFLRRHGGPQRARIMSISGSSPGPPGAHQEHQRLPGRDPGGASGA